MIVGTVITLGGLAYTVVYSVHNYGALVKYGTLKYWYLAALAIYNLGAIAALATQHPCYQFVDVGISAVLINVLFVFFPDPNYENAYEVILRTALFLAYLGLFSNAANCANDCCRH